MKITKTKLIAYCGMIALLSSLIVGLLGFTSSTNDINEVKNRLLERSVETNINLTMKYIHNSYGVLSQGDETLLDSHGNSIEGRFGVVDSVLEDLGDQSTIFVKVNDDFRRLTTNVMSDENERAIGTYLGKEHKAYDTVMRGNLYIGEADILDESYYTAYRPIKDNNNNVIGLLFVGTPTKVLDGLIEGHDAKMSNINMFIIALRAISLGSLVALVGISAANKKQKTLLPRKQSKQPKPYLSKETYGAFE